MGWRKSSEQHPSPLLCWQPPWVGQHPSTPAPQPSATPVQPSTAHVFYGCCKGGRCKREILKLQSFLTGLDHPGLSHLPLVLQCKCRGSPFSSNYTEFHISPLTCEYLSKWEFPRNYTWLVLPKHKYGPSLGPCTTFSKHMYRLHLHRLHLYRLTQVINNSLWQFFTMFAQILLLLADTRADFPLY